MLLQGRIAESAAHISSRRCATRHNIVRPAVRAAVGRVRRGSVHAGAVGSPVREAAGGRLLYSELRKASCTLDTVRAVNCTFLTSHHTSSNVLV
jgi:hypothetical protein